MQDTEACHFWIGRFPEEASVEEYFAEVWDEDDEDYERTPLSAFARDQGERWYDHDLLEQGFAAGAASIQELVAGASYSEQWADELARRASEAGLSGANLLVMISQDQIDIPRSVQGDGYWLQYLGTIQYRS